MCISKKNRLGNKKSGKPLEIIHQVPAALGVSHCSAEKWVPTEVTHSMNKQNMGQLCPVVCCVAPSHNLKAEALEVRFT